MATIPNTVVDKAAWVDLRELDEHGEALTSWEIEFVERLTRALRMGATLTPAQREKLDEIREARLS